MTLVVAALAVFGAMNSYSLSADYARYSPDSFGSGRAQTRFSGVVEKLPPSARIGYFTDLDPKATLYTSEFLAVQYALAPRQLVMLGQGPAPEWAVGNFSKPQDYAAAGQAQGYAIADDFGNGVVLFRRKQ